MASLAHNLSENGVCGRKILFNAVIQLYLIYVYEQRILNSRSYISFISEYFTREQR
jgi:hypothetical protein